MSRVQTEVHNKLLERFAGTGDLMAYVQSSAGRRFLESAPIPLDPGPRTVAAPLGRILWSVQAGVVLSVVGVGFEVVSRRVIEDVGQPLALFGVLAIALGFGFILSGVVSYALSRKLGLLEPLPAAVPERHDRRPPETMMRDLTVSELERLAAQPHVAEVAFQMDEEAFRAFYDRTARVLWAYLARLTGDGGLADDLSPGNVLPVFKGRSSVRKRRAPAQFPVPHRDEPGDRPPTQAVRRGVARCRSYARSSSRR